MRLPRVQLSVRMLMVLVAVTTVILGSLIELLVNRPQRIARERSLVYHSRKAAEFLRMSENNRHLIGPELKGALIAMSAWHTRRMKEIEQSSSFDVDTDKKINLEHHQQERDVLHELDDSTQSY
jgi:hypothetical protein